MKSVHAAFVKGSLHGRFRSVYCTTINQEPLPSYYAVAAGGVLKYETATFKKFTAVVGGSFTYNLSSSDLGVRDSLSGARSRYELQMMDINNPYNTNNMFRLDWLCLKYSFSKSYLTWGKQYVVTPFINQQDLYMRSSVVDGMYSHLVVNDNLLIEAAYIYGISASATTNWGHVSESIGVFPNGVNVNGSPGDYANNLHGGGLAFLGVHGSVRKNMKFEVWNQYVHQIFNTALLQVDYSLSKIGQHTFIISLQAIGQNHIGNGGNANVYKAYYSPDNNALIMGGRIALRSSKTDLSLNYTRITSDGRYQMPREWGREPMFTFLMREQIEGAGNVHAASLHGIHTFTKLSIKVDAGIGYYKMPDVLNSRLNKYGMPTYMQYYVLGRYSFRKKLKGLDVELVYMYKQKLGDSYGIYKYVINRVNMSHVSAGFRFTF